MQIMDYIQHFVRWIKENADYFDFTQSMYCDFIDFHSNKAKDCEITKAILYDFLMRGICWSDTQQGSGYWVRKYNDWCAYVNITFKKLR